jgi:hypothetical protein
MGSENLEGALGVWLATHSPESPERLQPLYVKTFDETMRTAPGELEFSRRADRDGVLGMLRSRRTAGRAPEGPADRNAPLLPV